MTTSTFNQDIFNARLEQLVADKKLTRNSIVYRTLKNLPEVIRPCTVSGSGRFTKNNDQTSAFAAALNKMEVKFEQGNDAPRGGKAGNFIKIIGFYTEEELEAQRKAKAEQEARLEEIRNRRGKMEVVEKDGACLVCFPYGFYAPLPVAEILAVFKEHGFNVTEEALWHNFDAWKADYKSNYHDEENGYDLYSACGCNELRFWASPINSNLRTYIA